MELESYVEKLRQQLAVAAAAGGEEAVSLAQRLTAALEPAFRMALLDALSAATAEITSDLAPGSVELRLRQGEPEFVVTMPPPGSTDEDADRGERTEGPDAGAAPVTAGDGATARINLRLPDRLKSQVEQSAGREALSTNAWLVRAIAAAVDQAQRGAQRGRPGSHPGQRYRGWGR